MHLGGRKSLRSLANQLFHRAKADLASFGQQSTQRFIHGCLAFHGRQMQDRQILPNALDRRLGNELVVGHPEMAGGEHLFAVAIVLERAWLANQPGDHVSIIDPVLASAPKTWEMLDKLARVPHADLLSAQVDVHLLSNEPAGNGVGVAIHLDRAGRPDTSFDALDRLEAPRGQRSQNRLLLVPSLSTKLVALVQQFLKEPFVGRTALELPAASKQQRLFHGSLEAMVGLFDVAVLVPVVGLRLLHPQAIVIHQRLVTPCELLPLGQVVHRRAEPVGPMTFGNSTQLEQRLLQTLRQTLEALRKANSRRLPVRVGQHEVVHHVIETMAGDAHGQFVHRREVRCR